MKVKVGIDPEQDVDDQFECGLEHSFFLSEFVAELSCALRGILHGVDDARLHIIRFERRERALGGTAFRRDLCA